MTRDHGGDLDRARALYGGGDWIDLSTGINRVPYPVPPLPPEAWTALPTPAATAGVAADALALNRQPVASNNAQKRTISVLR